MGLIIEHLEGVAILTLDDPRRRNMLSAEMCADIIAAVEAAEADPTIHVLVVTGSAPAFCSGGGLDDLKAAAEGNDAAIHAVYRSFMAVADCALPTIAAVNGPAVGAGFNLALACDIRIAAPTASFDSRFLQIGLHPGGGHSWMLLRAVGWAAASRILLAGKVVGSDEAQAIGLVSEVVDEAGLRNAALELAKPMATTPRELLLRTKMTMRSAATASHREIFAHETQEQAWSIGQPAFVELLARLQDKIANRR